MILAAEWIFPVTSPPLYRHAIEVENGVIQRIRPLLESDPFFANAALLPGLVNAHTHLAYTAMRNRFDALDFFPWIRALIQFKNQLTPEEIRASTLLGINECIRGGVTTVADMSDMEPALHALSESPLRGIFYWEVFGVEKEMAEESWRRIQQTYPRLRHEYESVRLKIGISPHACYTVRPELYEKIAQWAISDRIPVSFHLAESKDEEAFIGKRAGVLFDLLEKRTLDWPIRGTTSTTHLESTGIFDSRPLLAHVVQIGPNDLARLRGHDVTIAHCPKSNAKFGHGIAPVADLMRAGFRVGIGTDSAASNNRLDLFEEARFALLQQRNRYGAQAVSESQALEWITIGGARALRMEDRIGSLQPGKEADCILIQLPSYYSRSEQVLSHLVHNTVASDVLTTYIRGQQISPEDVTEPILEIYRKPS